MFVLKVHSVDLERPISVEEDETGFSYASKRAQPPEKLVPSLKLTERKGLIHLYGNSSHSSLPNLSSRSTILFVVAVPNYFSSLDFIRFCDSRIAHVSEMLFIRNDGMEDRYNVLIKLSDQSAADGFYKNLNGKKYEPSEAEVCHILYVMSVEYTEFDELAASPPAGFTELPTCPICLERLDPDTSGIVSTLCGHSFQCSCTSKWNYLSCQVCRLCQQQDEILSCSICGKTGNLWACLVCGFLGCGRYKEGHSIRHWKETHHCYSLGLGTQQIWNYVDECYVHRLNHSRIDGKSVKMNTRCLSHEGECGLFNSKVDSIVIEYNDLLASQLKAQRQYYESLIVEARSKQESSIADAVEQTVVNKMQALHIEIEKCEEEKNDITEVNRKLINEQETWRKKAKEIEEREAALLVSKDLIIDELEEHDEEDLDENESTAENKVGCNRKRSKCWRNFKIIGDKLSDGRNDVRCNYCNHSYCIDLRRNDTTTLLRHMKVCSKTHGSTHVCGNRKLDMMVFREMIGLAIIEHGLPYSFVEYKRIREVFLYANSSIEFWSRNTVATDCLKIYEKEKMKLRQVLNEVPGRFCLTTDLWRAPTIEGYMCLAAHYVDSDWNLKTKILSFCVFPPPYTGAAIATKVLALIKEWGLEKRVFTITVDNASSNDNMQGILKRQLRKNLVCNGEFFHIRCVSHILNLIVQSGLNVIDGALEKIRDSVKFVKVSEIREQSFQTCVETMGIEAKAGLVLDVKSRWNSTHLMLSRAIMYKEAFGHLAEIDTSYKTFPSDIEWKRAKLICEFLTLFAEMTNLISSSSYPTANLYFMQVWKIKNWLKAHEESTDEVICEMVESMKDKFDMYWEEYSDILAIAAVFDPRLKFTVLVYCFNTLDASTSQSKLDHVRKKLNKLFEVYKKNPKKTVVGTSTNTLEHNILPGYDGFYAFMSQTVGASGKSALDKYLDEPVLDMMAFKSLDVLAYWRDNANRFKELSSMACDVLSIPITIVASESSFSIGSRVLNKYRSSLIPSNVQALICARNWLCGFEEIGDQFDQFEFSEEDKEGEEEV